MKNLNRNRPNYTVIKVSNYISLSDYGVIDPYTGVVYDSLRTIYLEEISQNIIITETGRELSDDLSDVLMSLPCLNLN